MVPKELFLCQQSKKVGLLPKLITGHKIKDLGLWGLCQEQKKDFLPRIFCKRSKPKIRIFNQVLVAPDVKSNKNCKNLKMHISLMTSQRDNKFLWVLNTLYLN